MQTERKRLIDLLDYQEHCRFCDMCRECPEMRAASLNALADHLIANGVIVPPCNVGDTVYVLTHDAPTGIEKSRVKRMLLQKLQDGTTIKIIVPCVFDDWGNAVREVYPEDFGKTVFLTKEEAEKALAERSKE